MHQAWSLAMRPAESGESKSTQTTTERDPQGPWRIKHNGSSSSSSMCWQCQLLRDGLLFRIVAGNAPYYLPQYPCCRHNGCEGWSVTPPPHMPHVLSAVWGAPGPCMSLSCASCMLHRKFVLWPVGLCGPLVVAMAVPAGRCALGRICFTLKL